MSVANNLYDLRKDFEKYQNIAAANRSAVEILKKLQGIKPYDSGPFFSTDADFAVFGSLARLEASDSSDVDWTILIDGQTKPEHSALGHFIRHSICNLNLKQPGSQGMFGQITFSHDLIHFIGGEDDTNHNLSRRILLLLESKSVGLNSTETSEITAYGRVLRNIINEYISHDSSFGSHHDSFDRVPKFLLNDIIRFWRTMCVDFAYKQKTQDGQKWALRNVKLRMSRKLLFIKGLLMCLSCYENETIETPEDVKLNLEKLAGMEPLSAVATLLSEAKISDDKIDALINSYDLFLGYMADEEIREHLSSLEMRKVYEDSKFLEIRDVTKIFQERLNSIFLNEDNKLKRAILEHGVF